MNALCKASGNFLKMVRWKARSLMCIHAWLSSQHPDKNPEVWSVGTCFGDAAFMLVASYLREEKLQFWAWKLKQLEALQEEFIWCVTCSGYYTWLTASQCRGCLGREPWRYCPAALSDTGTNGKCSAASWNSGTACGFSGVQHSTRVSFWRFGVWDNRAFGSILVCSVIWGSLFG